MLSKLDTRAYTGPQASVLEARLAEPRRFIQVVAGPRQVGKTTLARQGTQALGRPSSFHLAEP